MRRLRYGTLRCPQPEFVAVLRGRATSHMCLMVILSRAELGTSHGYSTLLVAYFQPQALLLLYVPFTPTTWSPDCSHPGVGILVCLLMYLLPQVMPATLPTLRACVGWTMVLWAHPKRSLLQGFKWDAFLLIKALLFSNSSKTVPSLKFKLKFLLWNLSEMLPFLPLNSYGGSVLLFFSPLSLFLKHAQCLTIAPGPQRALKKVCWAGSNIVHTFKERLRSPM